MAGVNEIRSAFLDYFAREGHRIVPSSSLVPRNDPTLMFTNAGMNQFKNIFTGVETPGFPTAVTSQKCVRAGGKHNDLENVGYTARHHTFFEMLGNFSFGDYFKERAIELAWRLITKEFGLPEKRLIVTVYAEDDDAHALWRKIAGLPGDRIIRIPTSDNFWSMGDTGPCGPCSEIFYDHGDHVAGGPPGSADADGDRFIEIWNLVFMQFEQRGAGERLLLPKPSIDTGMGLERVSAVLQGTHDNYATDLMRALIGAVADATGVDPEDPRGVSHRVIADHLRATSFLIADGVSPANEGRGYVLRRIMRRAMRHAHLLGAKEPLLWRLVPALQREMGTTYPELMRAGTLITETLRLEETKFRSTLANGLAILDTETRNMSAGDSLSGAIAFMLHDTYGFPLDLTQDALRPRGIKVDTEGFEAAMEAQRERARAGWTGSGEQRTDDIWFGERQRFGATEFLGYETLTAEAVVRALFRDGREIASLKADESGLMLLNQTPCYAESGGQIGDTAIVTAPGLKLRVTDTQKRVGDLFVHSVSVDEGVLAPGAEVAVAVDAARRHAIQANHSATHLAHEALRRVLGDHVAQKGSLVAPDRLRFDFAQPRPVTQEELRRVEDVANAAILQDAPVETHLMAIDDALASGARALFGEKYGDVVRVVSMGKDLEGANKAYSVELCGGTHVGRTGEIGLLAITSESGVASGVRRIEALTGNAARAHLNAESQALAELAQRLKCRKEEVGARVGDLIEEKRRQERELAELRRKLVAGSSSTGGAAARDVAGIAFVGLVLDGVPAGELKGLIDERKRELGSGVAAIVTRGADGKGTLAVGVTEDLTDRCDAVTLVKAGAQALGGRGGGGRRDLAQAGGPDGSRAEAAIEAIETALRERLSAAA
ncbi:alanyl-tRNA synthetase [Rhizobiales bacterium GAS188]|nr:alanyl-tRNA synthetase [Rhizobiales bacterium GAS188]